MNNKEKNKCEFIFKNGNESMKLKAYQSPRGIRFEGKRPNLILIDCCQEFNFVGLKKHIEYLQELAFAIEFQ